MTEHVDPARCPICGRDNRCGNLQGKPPGTCWCSRASFPSGIFDKIPPERRRKACICQACLEQYLRSQSDS